MRLTVLRIWKRHDTTYLEEGNFIWHMQLWKTKRIILHKIAYPAPAQTKVIAVNTEDVCDLKCLDIHNSKRYGLIAAAPKKCATADQGMRHVIQELVRRNLLTWC